MFSFPRSACVSLTLGLATITAAAPCDILAKAGSPCVAAHGLTRALFDSYKGRLYQLLRGDGKMADVHTLSPGGTANATDQDDFCKRQTCCISIIYDQSGNENHLTRAPGGSAAKGPEPNGYDEIAGAYGAPVTLNGKRAFGLFGSPFTGYRADKTKKIPTGNDPEGIYAVFDGTHYNGKCCFDYGNAETNNKDQGAGAMETLYFGLGDHDGGIGTGIGGGSGPWIMADLENNLFAGPHSGTVVENEPANSRFVAGFLSGYKWNYWELSKADGQKGGITDIVRGSRPSGYGNMKKHGAIVLGVGGDNSDGSQGTFYEGAITNGAVTPSVYAKVQSDIVHAKYEAADLNIGPRLTIGSIISLRVTTPKYTNRVLAHQHNQVKTRKIKESSLATQFKVRKGLGNSGCFSLESVDNPGSFIRHRDYNLYIEPMDTHQPTYEDATWCTQPGVNGQGMTFRSWNHAARYMRHYKGILHLGANGGFNDFDTANSFVDDVSWLVTVH